MSDAVSDQMTYAGEPANLNSYMSDGQESQFRSTFQDECCAHCRFWKELDGPWFNEAVSKALKEGVPWYEGDCHRHAPVVIVPKTEENTPWWPKTQYGEWCGDFERS